MRTSGMVLVAGLVLLMACSDTAGPTSGGGGSGSAGEPAPAPGTGSIGPRAPSPDPGQPGATPDLDPAPCSVSVPLIEEDPGPLKC